ncbi:MAG: hypothetical protein ACXW3P_02865 [Rhodospirillales bacterium]
MDSLLTVLDQRPPEMDVRARRRRLQAARMQQQLSAVDQDAFAPLAALLSKRYQPWLPAALAELDQCSEEAQEEGYPVPTPEALATAEAILRRIAALPADLPEPSVYPSAEREIVLFFCRSEAKAAVSLSVDEDGGGACFSNVSGLRRARYGDVSELPDAFMQSEFLKLSRLAPAE